MLPVYLTFKILQNRITDTEVAMAMRILIGRIVMKYVMAMFCPVQTACGPSVT